MTQFEQIVSDIAEIKEILIERRSCFNKVTQLHEWAFGNGNPGADELLRKLVEIEKQRIEEKQEENIRWLLKKETERNRWTWTLWNMVPAIIVGVVIGIIMSAVQLAF